MKNIIISSCILVPFFSFGNVFAQTANPALASTVNIFVSIGQIVSTISSFAIAVVFLYFFWTVIEFLRAEPGKKDEARKSLLYGILAIFIVVSIWAIVGFLQGLFGLSTSDTGSGRGQIVIPRAQSSN